MQRARRVGLGLFVAILVCPVVSTLPSSPVAAVNEPTVAKSAPANVLAGESIPYTITVDNPGPDPLYNLSFRDVLAPGATYVSPSTPAAAGDPDVYTALVEFPLGSGNMVPQQTLVWANVADLQVADTFELGFNVALDPAIYLVGATVDNASEAYGSINPRFVPRFDPTTGAPAAIQNPAIRSAASNSTSTDITAIRIEKDEPSPEGELLRGVHDFVTTYTLRVDTTSFGPVDDVVVTEIAAGAARVPRGATTSTTRPPRNGRADRISAPARRSCRASNRSPSKPSRNQRRGVHAGDVESRPPARWHRSYSRVHHPVRSRHPVVRQRALHRGRPDAGVAGAGFESRQQHGCVDTRADRRVVGHQPGHGERGLPGTVVSGSERHGLRRRRTDADDRRRQDHQDRRHGFVPGRRHGPLHDRRGHQRVRVGDRDHGHRPDAERAVSRRARSRRTRTTTRQIRPAAPRSRRPVRTSPRSAAFPLRSLRVPRGTTPPAGSRSCSRRSTSPPAPRRRSTTRVACSTSAPAGGPPSSGDSFTNTVTSTATTEPIPPTVGLPAGPVGGVVPGVVDESSWTLITTEHSIEKTLRPRDAGSLAPGPVSCPTTDPDAVYIDSDDVPPSEQIAKLGYRRGDIVCFRLRANFDTHANTRNPVIVDFLPPGTPGSSPAPSWNFRTTRSTWSCGTRATRPDRRSGTSAPPARSGTATYNPVACSTSSSRHGYSTSNSATNRSSPAT